jgi:hypothetical protein
MVKRPDNTGLPGCKWNAGGDYDASKVLDNTKYQVIIADSTETRFSRASYGKLGNHYCTVDKPGSLTDDLTMT